MNSSINKATCVAILGIGSTLVFSGCSSNDNNTAGADTEVKAQSAVIATVAADFSAGAHAVFSTADPYANVTQQSPTVSDITVVCHGEHFYRIERFSGENVTRFHISKPDEVLTQFSTQDTRGVEAASSNPHTLVFASDTKAYLLRYGSDKAWIVNPAATTDAEYKIGELDLSAYSNDGVPNMTRGIVVDDKLYIVLQRLAADFSPQDAYVAVFDTNTDTEIDTAPNSDGLNGILLPLKNPGDIEVLVGNNLIYVQGTGRFGSSLANREPEYTGGVATIDPANDYATTLIFDDGDADTHPVGLITGMEIISETKGYLIGYTGFTDNTLFSFDPSSGTLDTDASGKPVAVAGIESTSIRGLAVDNNGTLWVGIADDTAPGVKLVKAADGSVISDLLATTLNPSTITMCDAPAESP